MSLYLVRHPRPVGHPGCCYGRTELGVAPAEIEAAYARVREAIGTRVALVEAGRLERAAVLDAAIRFGSVHALEAPCAR